MNDASAIRELAGDKRIAEGTFIPHPYKDPMALEYIRDCNTGWEEGNGISFAITLRNGKKLVGSISLKDINKEHRRAEMGYWVGVPWWGNGYATEAAREVIDFGFRDLNLNKISAGHFHTNPASGRIMQKTGMKKEGVKREHILHFGKYRDLTWYSILRKEWEKIKQPE